MSEELDTLRPRVEAAVKLAKDVENPPEPYRQRDCEQRLKAEAASHVALLQETFDALEAVTAERDRLRENLVLGQSKMETARVQLWHLVDEWDLDTMQVVKLQAATSQMWGFANDKTLAQQGETE